MNESDRKKKQEEEEAEQKRRATESAYQGKRRRAEFEKLHSEINICHVFLTKELFLVV